MVQGQESCWSFIPEQVRQGGKGWPCLQERCRHRSSWVGGYGGGSLWKLSCECNGLWGRSGAGLGAREGVSRRTAD